MSKLHELDKLIGEFENELVLTKSINQLATRLQQESRDQSGKLNEAREQLIATSSSLIKATQKFNEISFTSASSTKEQLDNLEKQQNEGRIQLSKQSTDQFNKSRDQQDKNFVELSNNVKTKMDGYHLENRHFITHQKEAHKQLNDHLDKSLSQQNKQLDNHSNIVQIKLDDQQLVFKRFGEQQNEAVKQQNRLFTDQFSELHIRQNKHFVDLSGTIQTRLDNHRSEIRQIVEREVEKLSSLFVGRVGELETTLQSQSKTLKILSYTAIVQTILISFAVVAKVLRWW
ncbi:hypothetical protein [Fibrella aquatilis]|uniref:Uncharacterized protein n=1 Tax=Fibrella aquatilis TaxID=2817059 RepID=A0A939G9A5_9BACT|nr:hypothetical protein [Fibrella aquatilis]MBO0932436.1 hypothetical protein [Fibrella aquatilis]